MVDTETTPFVDSSVHWSYLPVLDVFCFFFPFPAAKVDVVELSVQCVSLLPDLLSRWSSGLYRRIYYPLLHRVSDN